MQGTYPGKTNASIIYIPPISESNLSSHQNVANYFYYSGVLTLIVFALIIASIGLIIYGLLKKPKASAKQMDEELEKERDSLYSNLQKPKNAETRAKNNKSSRRKQHGKRN